MAAARDRIVIGLGLVAMLCACPRAGEGPAAAIDRTAGGNGTRVLRVGNPSRGVDEQPDYDKMALEVRDRVESRLGDPLPPVHDACVGMLDAAVAMYRRTEADGTMQASRLDATRERDLAACESETSASAAVCVTLLLGDEAGEWPWLLDQCSRAFPRG